MSYEKVTKHQSRLIIGTKQTMKAMKNGEIAEVFIAEDADSELTEGIADAALELGIPFQRVDSMSKLGKASGVEVGASAVAIKK